MLDLTGTTALVTGTGRGFGKAIATALIAAGADVVGLARTTDDLDRLRDEIGDAFIPVAADATEPATASQYLRMHRPRIVVLNAGAVPPTGPIHHHTWQSFSRNWAVDVQHVFHWVREALLLPLDPGTSVITVSSGAALAGSPLSGGYAGAKATIRMITSYAATESARDNLGIRFVSVLPKLTPATELGRAGIAAYADRQGMTVPAFVEQLGPILTADQVATAIVVLATTTESDQNAYLLTDTGISPIQ